MHLSDIALECAADCLALAETTTCPRLARALAAIAHRLADAASQDAAICVDGEDFVTQPSIRPSGTRH